MATINLLYQSRYPINDSISVEIPTVGQILDCEDDYYSVINAFTAMPIDMIVPLDEAKIDFTTLTEWDLFILMFKGVQEQDTSLVLGNLDLSKFVMDVSPQNGSIILKDRKTGVVIDRAIHGKIATVLRLTKRQNGRRTVKPYRSSNHSSLLWLTANSSSTTLKVSEI